MEENIPYLHGTKAKAKYARFLTGLLGSETQLGLTPDATEAGIVVYRHSNSGASVFKGTRKVCVLGVRSIQQKEEKGLSVLLDGNSSIGRLLVNERGFSRQPNSPLVVKYMDKTAELVAELKAFEELTCY